MSELLVAGALVLGGGFVAVAGIGMLRLPDVLIRMHASTKAGTLGCGLVVLGVAGYTADALAITKALLVVLFLLLTAPVAAHLIGRAAYRSGTPLWEGTHVDESAAFRRDAETAAGTTGGVTIGEGDERGESRAPTE